MSLTSLDVVIQLGQDIMALKFYSLANGAILFYDYFLTLEDEITYAWSGNKSWTFYVFLINRYFPMTGQIWQFIVSYGPPSTFEYANKMCSNSSFYPLITFAACSLIAQTIMTTRMYAVTMKNIPITLFFASITLTQCVLGFTMVGIAVKNGAPTPFVAILAPNRNLEVAYTGLSLFYDGLAFLMVTYWARRSRAKGVHFTTILDTISEDATWYFMVIFTAHFVLVMTLNLGRVTIQLLPGSGIVVYLPVMISRIMLSLKKAATSSKRTWGITEQTTFGGTVQSVLNIATPPIARSGKDDEDFIQLETFRAEVLTSRSETNDLT